MTVGQDAANTGLVTNTAPARLALQRRPRRHPPARPTTRGYSHRPDPGHRPERQRLERRPTLERAPTGFVVDTDGARRSPASARARLADPADAQGTVTFTFTANKNIDPTSAQRQLDPGRPGRPRRHLRHGRRRGRADRPGEHRRHPAGEHAARARADHLQPSSATWPTTSTRSPSRGRAPARSPTSPATRSNGTAGDARGATSPRATSSSTRRRSAPASSSARRPRRPSTAAAGRTGRRANPFPTIHGGDRRRGAGDIVAVLPGVYTENITLKSLVRLAVGRPDQHRHQPRPGQRRSQTIIRPRSTPTAPRATSPSRHEPVQHRRPRHRDRRLHDRQPAARATRPSGSIDPSSIGVADRQLERPDRPQLHHRLRHRRSTSSRPAATAPTPRIDNDGIVGNIDRPRSSTTTAPPARSPTPVNVVQQHDRVQHHRHQRGGRRRSRPDLADGRQQHLLAEPRPDARPRAARRSSRRGPNKVILRNNLFSGNGPSETNPADDAINVGSGFNPAALGATPDALGNFTGDPAFVAPRDPRPGADGPATFFLDANFDLTAKSAAIDAAIESSAPPTDFLCRGRVDDRRPGLPRHRPGRRRRLRVPGDRRDRRGRVVPGRHHLARPGGATQAAGASSPPRPSAIIVDFSDNVDQSSVSADRPAPLGHGLSRSTRPSVTGVTWIDNHTVAFTALGPVQQHGDHQRLDPGRVGQDRRQRLDPGLLRHRESRSCRPRPRPRRRRRPRPRPPRQPRPRRRPRRTPRPRPSRRSPSSPTRRPPPSGRPPSSSPPRNGRPPSSVPPSCGSRPRPLAAQQRKAAQFAHHLTLTKKAAIPKGPSKVR